jgi:hypothetical protein
MASAFPAGVVVFFRILDTTANQLARSYHPTGRHVVIQADTHHPEDYVILDAEGELLGVYPRDFVSAILPIITVGPGEQKNASNSEGELAHIKTTAPRDPSKLS